MNNDTYDITVAELIQEVLLAEKILNGRAVEEGRTRGRLAVAAIVGESETFGIAEENRPGYWPPRTRGLGLSYPRAKDIANEVNAKLGLTPEDASAIIISSMREQNVMDGAFDAHPSHAHDTHDITVAQLVEEVRLISSIREQHIMDVFGSFPAPDHTHECRDCSALIDAGVACETTGPGQCSWPGGNAGCEGP